MLAQLLTGSYLDYVTERTGMKFSPDATAVAAVDDAGRFHGMVAWDDWKLNSVQMHVRLDDWGATRTLLWPAFYHPMIERGRGWVRAEVRASNKRSVELVRRLGFQEMARLEGGWAPGEDLFLFAMHRDDCRWLNRRKKAA